MSIDSKEVLARLQSEAAPLSFAKLKKAFGVKKRGPTEMDLRQALTGEGIYPWPKNYYWHVDPVAQLNVEIVALCRNKALKKTEIKVKGYGTKTVASALDELIKNRKIIKYPALTGASFLLVADGAPETYWEYVREVVTAKLKKPGIEETAVGRVAVGQADLAEKIWEILPTLEPELNVPVSTARIRRAVGAVEKRHFDEAALNLREQRRVYLSQHDHPLGLNEQDRDLLIDGKDGRYYVAITRLGQ